MKKYGILIGRFQPLHLAHQSIINEILHDGLIPIVFIGSSNRDKSGKNPFSYIERAQMLHEVYGNQVITLPSIDHEDDNVWYNLLLCSLEDIGAERSDCVLYFFRKENEFAVNEFFNNIEHKQPIYPHIYDSISATKIRENLEGYKQYLDGRIYKYLKNKGY